VTRDLTSLNNREILIEVMFYALVHGGVPLDFEPPPKPVYPPVLQAMNDRVAAYEAAVRNGTYVPPTPTQATSRPSDHHEHVASSNSPSLLDSAGKYAEGFLAALCACEAIDLTQQSAEPSNAFQIKVEAGNGWEAVGEPSRPGSILGAVQSVPG